MTLVVDTNVPKVANGGEWLVKKPECVQNCVARLREIQESGRIALDYGWLIAIEYKNQLRESGEPGVGDAFLRWVLTNIRNPDRCDLVPLAPFPDDPRLAGFDPADRKFVTVAIAHPEHPPILQATDAKWRVYAATFQEFGVNIEFLCS